MPEEPGAGNPHAGVCGGRAAASVAPLPRAQPLRQLFAAFFSLECASVRILARSAIHGSACRMQKQLP